MDPIIPHIQLGTASGQPITSASTCDIVTPQLPSYFPATGHHPNPKRAFSSDQQSVGEPAPQARTMGLGYRAC